MEYPNELRQAIEEMEERRGRAVKLITERHRLRRRLDHAVASGSSPAEIAELEAKKGEADRVVEQLKEETKRAEEALNDRITEYRIGHVPPALRDQALALLAQERMELRAARKDRPSSFLIFGRELGLWETRVKQARAKADSQALDFLLPHYEAAKLRFEEAAEDLEGHMTRIAKIRSEYSDKINQLNS